MRNFSPCSSIGQNKCLLSMRLPGSNPAKGIGVQRPAAGVVWTVVSKLNFERSGETGDYAAKRPHLGEWGLLFTLLSPLLWQGFLGY
jgi:hypothetical protein